MKLSRTASRTAVLALALTALLAAQSFGSTVLRFSNEELAKRADVIVHGKVTGQTCKAGEGPIIMTEYTLEVTELLKGGTAGAKTFTFLALGGTLDGKGYAISGSATYAADEEVLVFLDAVHPKTGCRHAIGLAQGKFTVKEEPESKKKFLVRDLGGLRMVDSAGKPIEVKAETTKLYIDAFKKEIKGYLEKKD